MVSLHREALKDFLGTFTEKILLDPDSLECRIHYKIGIENRNKVASPRGLDLIPHLSVASEKIAIP